MNRTFFGDFNLIPGLLLVSSITLISYGLSYLLEDKFGLKIADVVTIALFVSIITTNIWHIPKSCYSGIKFSLDKILTLAIILLGFRLNWVEVSLIGSTGLIIIVISLLFTFISTYWLGRYLGLNNKLIQLIACGTSICGTSAIVAVNGVLNAPEEDVACAAVTVTAFGTLAMILYPLLPDLLALTPQEFGLWCGSSIHQTSQVVAAGFQQGIESGELATISKLSRVIFLAPIAFCVGLLNTSEAKRSTKKSFASNLPIPFFIIVFIGVICLNSLNILPQILQSFLIDIDKILIAISMVAIGLETKLINLKKTGIKPMLLGAMSWICLSLMSLFLIKLFL